MSHSPRRALIVIDVQNEYFDGDMPITHPPVEASLPNILRAMEALAYRELREFIASHAPGR